MLFFVHNKAVDLLRIRRCLHLESITFFSIFYKDKKVTNGDGQSTRDISVIVIDILLWINVTFNKTKHQLIFLSSLFQLTLETKFYIFFFKSHTKEGHHNL